jgi:hypothetical protein
LNADAVHALQGKPGNPQCSFLFQRGVLQMQQGVSPRLPRVLELSQVIHHEISITAV